MKKWQKHQKKSDANLEILFFLKTFNKLKQPFSAGKRHLKHGAVFEGADQDFSAHRAEQATQMWGSLLLASLASEGLTEKCAIVFLMVFSAESPWALPRDSKQ